MRQRERWNDVIDAAIARGGSGNTVAAATAQIYNRTETAQPKRTTEPHADAEYPGCIKTVL